MEEVKSNEIVIYDSEGTQVQKVSSLEVQGNDITNKIIYEDDPDELDKLTQLFTLNQKKKQIARKNKLSILLDKVDDEVISRIEDKPYSIDDRDLLKYWSTASDIVNDKSEDDTLPRVQINNQTNINLNQSGLSRESRAKVLDVVNKIIGNLNSNDIIDVDINKEEDR